MNFDGLQWRKSSRSQASSDCVELAPAADLVAARDSKRPAQTPLSIDGPVWNSFARTLRTGRFDLG